MTTKRSPREAGRKIAEIRRAASTAIRNAAATLAATEAGRCRFCGCTYFDPCPAGCGWYDGRQTICTECVRIAHGFLGFVAALTTGPQLMVPGVIAGLFKPGALKRPRDPKLRAAGRRWNALARPFFRGWVSADEGDERGWAEPKTNPYADRQRARAWTAGRVKALERLQVEAQLEGSTDSETNRAGRAAPGRAPRKSRGAGRTRQPGARADRVSGRTSADRGLPARRADERSARRRDARER